MEYITQTKICEKLKRILKDENIVGQEHLADVSVFANLMEQYGMDSMGLIRFIVAIEEYFQIEFQDEQLLPEWFATIHDISELVMNCLELQQKR
ncbi:acyl carrier protein [Paenibacillus sp. S150]|uniref:acyl carrier protein n=1 Tax=Paenibacillus sp. S150 TaxID=2749826 RepID=UPI001C59C553|nr:acyl carrier protein [Paenibacillus sp. S150]MBW4085036.1 acyl carrier protein [Paenibacillus sp. S150]